MSAVHPCHALFRVVPYNAMLTDWSPGEMGKCDSQAMVRLRLGGTMCGAVYIIGPEKTVLDPFLGVMSSPARFRDPKLPILVSRGDG